MAGAGHDRVSSLGSLRGDVGQCARGHHTDRVPVQAHGVEGLLVGHVVLLALCPAGIANPSPFYSTRRICDRLHLMTIEIGDKLNGDSASYLVEAPIAEGGFGITYQARREADGLTVVVKTLRLDRMKQWKSLELFEREVAVLRQLDHPNIPDYIDSFTLGSHAGAEGLGPGSGAGVGP